jgi:hypothetical protein
MVFLWFFWYIFSRFGILYQVKIWQPCFQTRKKTRYVKMFGTATRVTRWVCEKFAQNLTPSILGQNHYRSQSYDRELQRQRCKILQRHAQPSAFLKPKTFSFTMKNALQLQRWRCM